MTCPTCGRKTVAGSCADGFIPYLSGDYPCPFNPDACAMPKNLKELPSLTKHVGRVLVPSSSEGLEDLL